VKKVVASGRGFEVSSNMANLLGTGKLVLHENEVEQVCEQLEKISVDFTAYPTKSGGAWIVIADSSMNRLPVDEATQERYMPHTEDSGWSIYPVYQEDVEDFAQ